MLDAPFDGRQPPPWFPGARRRAPPITASFTPRPMLLPAPRWHATADDGPIRALLARLRLPRPRCCRCAARGDGRVVDALAFLRCERAAPRARQDGSTQGRYFPPRCAPSFCHLPAYRQTYHRSFVLSSVHTSPSAITIWPCSSIFSMLIGAQRRSLPPTQAHDEAHVACRHL